MRHCWDTSHMLSALWLALQSCVNAHTPQQLALVPPCFGMIPLLPQLVGTMCVPWVNGLSEQDYFLKFQLHFKYSLRLWAKSWCFEKRHSDNCTNEFSHTHLIKVNEKCATKISTHGTTFSPHYVHVTPIYTESMEREKDLQILLF